MLKANVISSAKTLHARMQILAQFTISKCHNFYIIGGSIVKSSVSVQKFPSFILVQRNQKSGALSGLYSCLCKDV